MKRILITFLLISLISVLTGCSILNDTAESSDTAAGSEALAANAQTAQWPTEKWSTSDPEKQDINTEQLEKANKRIEENYPNIYSLLVIRHGFLTYEKYYNGADQDSINPVYSVTKSVMSALTGIALHEKLLNSTDQRVSELIPEYYNSIDDNRKKGISLYNVLTMTGGLETIDSNYPGYFSSPDWLQYALQKPMTDEQGSKFVYNTGLTHMISGIITEKSKMSTRDFADKYLFGPLNINVQRWDRDSKGCYGGGTGLYLTARDMAKFGYLYLNKGKWEGKQIIPEDWVAASTSKKVSVADGVDYGYLFWIQSLVNKTTGKAYSTYRCDGAGGQKVIVIPELDMIVVVTANLNSSSRDSKDTQNMVEDYVLPAVK